MSNGSIPEGAKPLSHQVAGHFHSDDRPGFLESEDGFILKPLQGPPRGPKELQFYERVFSAVDPPSHVKRLREFLPQYYGSFTHGDVTYIRLEDLTKKFKKPCIADLKMGAITYDPEATEAKKARELSKYAHLHKVGFQIRGMRVYNLNTGEYDTYDKAYLRSFDEDEILTKGFAKLFAPGGQILLPVIKQILAKLYQMRSWFESQHEFSFYASSLLVVYEGDPENADVENLADVRQIDFAHVFPLANDNIDLNFLTGLRNLISYLEQLVAPKLDEQTPVLQAQG